MDQLNFDNGVRTYTINGKGQLRFHPGDPNLYNRFMQAVEQLAEMETILPVQAKGLPDDEQGALELLWQADKKIKSLLNWVFGQENDFDALLEGVNVLAVAANGKRVLENLMDALTPVLEEGAQSCAGKLAEEHLS